MITSIRKKVLDVLKPHIFFDDQLGHLTPASETTPSVHIPFGLANKTNKANKAELGNPLPPSSRDL